MVVAFVEQLLRDAGLPPETVEPAARMILFSFIGLQAAPALAGPAQRRDLEVLLLDHLDHLANRS
jgi:hypothetical protein